MLLSTSSGLAEVIHRPAPNYNGLPGNDLMVTLGSTPVNPKGFLAQPFAHWRTIVHELGHTLGLRHCGTHPIAAVCQGMPSSYESLMSAHQLVRGTGVNSFSPRVPGTPDPTYDDWFNLKHDSARALIHVGNTRTLGLGDSGSGIFSELNPDMDREPGILEYEQANGPMDVDPPEVDIVSPTLGTVFQQSDDMTVTVEATDNDSVSGVSVTFDVDGSGAIDATGESVVATPIGSDQYEATFLNLAGPDGLRDLDARASDPGGNTGQEILPVPLPEPSVLLVILFALPLLAVLARLRRASSRA